MPRGQNHYRGSSFLAALMATGFITSIDFSDPEQVVINFDPTIPASKFVSAGFDLPIADGWASGVDLLLHPLVIPDSNFAAQTRATTSTSNA